jgi:hypothetical protein
MRGGVQEEAFERELQESVEDSVAAATDLKRASNALRLLGGGARGKGKGKGKGKEEGSLACPTCGRAWAAGEGREEARAHLEGEVGRLTLVANKAKERRDGCEARLRGGSGLKGSCARPGEVTAFGWRSLWSGLRVMCVYAYVCVCLLCGVSGEEGEGGVL